MPTVIRKIVDNILRLPELKNFKEDDFDSPLIADIQRKIFHKKRIIKVIYQEYCRPFIESAQRAPYHAQMIEIGSGASPLKDYIPNLVCTDLIKSSWLDASCSAYALPFKDHSLDRIFLMFVCHHLGNIEKFFNEAYRCLKKGGEIVIADPAITLFSKFYYKYFHIDSMNLNVKDWSFEDKGRLSSSNIALPWIIFFRDKRHFKKLYPKFSIEKTEYTTCISFLLSGGLRIRQLLPTYILKKIFALENWIIRNISNQFAVTMIITIKRR